jgi:hypothetical protein
VTNIKFAEAGPPDAAVGQEAPRPVDFRYDRRPGTGNRKGQDVLPRAASLAATLLLGQTEPFSSLKSVKLEQPTEEGDSDQHQARRVHSIVRNGTTLKTSGDAVVKNRMSPGRPDRSWRSRR